ncbi:hypothetical protein KSP40_PGU016089 [Platanthera guangdongensis]|uniref:Trichome birefringence-like N-terminal domain-containing protein n=1 Tax=Platanthera guangdongensis TaxID=2320717 RepID=A0ABR2M8P9_9ASPA
MIGKAPTTAAAMDLRKHHYLDHYLATISSKRRFVLGVAASFFVVSLMASTICPAAASSSSASLFSWFFSVSSRFSFHRSNDSATASSYVGNSTPSSSFLADSGNGTSATETLKENYSRSDSDRGSVKIHQCSPVNSSSLNPDEIMKTQTLFGKTEAASRPPEVKKSVPANYTDTSQNFSARKNNETKDSMRTIEGVYLKKCDIYDGRWVRDVTKPHYPPGSCPYIDGDFDCFKNGRPDDEYLRWRWQPHGCNIPSLNATDFLERLRGKRLLFVGDSLNRNMWESLICILRNGIKDKRRVYEVSGRSKFKMQGYYSLRFEDYMCSVDFVRSPFLVKEQFLKNANGSEDERLRLDLLDESTPAYHRADIVVFNTGHWWTHEKTSSGIYYYQEGNHVYPVLEVMKAYKKALITWAEWVDRNINSHKTQVVFRGYSLTHFRGGQWNSGGQCHKETEPIYNETFIAKYPEKMIALEGILHNMETQVVYLNISRLTDYRKDGHPSIYRKKYNSTEEHIEAEKIQDCSHWCLPGVPDTWNELLYASLLREGRGSWKQ